MNIGLFGGTFNPFHNGHLGILKHVQDSFDLKKIFLIPSATPPHKPWINLAPATDRFKMVQKSLHNQKGLFVSDKELTRKGPSFTIDTINAFKNEVADDTQLFLLVGSDAFLDITTWKLKDNIFKAIHIIIMLRGETDNPKRISLFIDEHISKGYTFNKVTCQFCHTDNKKIFICRVPKIDISSTMIRTRIKNGLSIHGLVPKSVETLIQTKELYK
ncbi:MAG: nicotinate-nucleotide adenylyltransferase [Desulfobacula sp.]|nr:nicotinate-nucleotide adenylyltransferase [Desulfobacula sp.]